MVILRNLLSVFTAELIGKVIGFVTTVYLARVLQPEGFGILNFAAASAGYFMLLVNFGFNDYGVLKVSPDRSKQNIQRHVSNLFGLRLVIAMLSFGALIAISFIVPKFHKIQVLLLIFGLLALAHAVSTEWLFTAIERMEFIAIARIVGSLIYVALIFLLVKSADDLVPCGIVTIGRQFVVVCLMLVFLVWKIGGIRVAVNVKEWGDVLRFVLPIGLSSVAAQMYFNVDVVILGFLRSPEEVGYYSAALKLVMLGVGLKLLVRQVVYPKIVHYSATSKDTLQKASLLMGKYCIIFALFIGFMGSFLGKEIIHLIYGINFSDSIVPFQIAVWVIAVEFIGIVLPYIVLTVDRKLYAKIIISTVIINIVLNLILIPIIGIIGAAISYVASSFCLLGVCYYYLNKRVVSLPIARLFLKPLVGSFVMLLGMLIFQKMHFVIMLTCGTLLYWAMIAAQGITPAKLLADIRSMT